jgi:hypothetical protein
MGSRRLIVSAFAALAAALVWVPTAQATFHLMSIREVYPGSAAHPASGYVELQMYASGQNLVAGHALTVYNAAGTATGTFTFSSDVANAANQQTILIGDSGVQSTFGVAPDLTVSGIGIATAGGAACWAGSIDCVSWGSFSGSTPSASGSPADPSGIPDGKALRRTIEPGCPTLLEKSDDTNSSATDFFDATPNPRDNSSPIVETACAGPTTTIDSKPANPTNSTSASFTYHSTPSGASFECKLDTGSFKSCSASGIEYAGPLAEGTHTFQVRGKGAGEVLGAAASYSWRIDTTPPTAIIDTHPADPSSGASAAFEYHSNESGSSFECSLAAEGSADSFSFCPSTGKTYLGLADGSYTFKVRATDPAGNLGSAASFQWTVDNSVADTTPPETTILSAPSDPSDSSTAGFTYGSNEPGSRFECELDGAGFADCSAAGITYTGLANGSHSFEVRAIDPSANVDPTPAGYSFDVEVIQPPVANPNPAAPPSATPSVLAISTHAPPPPDTRITAKPHRRTSDRTPTLRFRANVVGARFQCSVDGGRFRLCRSPFTTRRLQPGRHRVEVRSLAGGVVDPTPAVTVFRVLERRGAGFRPRRKNRGPHHRRQRPPGMR